MIKFSLIFITILITYIASAQQIQCDTTCTKDTFLVHGNWTYDKEAKLPDVTDTFYATYCDYRKSLGLRYDVAFSQYFYSKSMIDWIGNHMGLNLNLAFAYENFNIGVRFKPWKTSPKSEVLFSDNLLPMRAKISSVKYDYFFSYEIDLLNQIAVEPSFGYTICKFNVTNTEEVEGTFNFNTTRGLLYGLTINKYFEFNNYKYLVLFARVNQGQVNYSEIHANFKGGYTEICLGISYKFYMSDREFKAVNL
ncbi:MAG: hypothetical protein MI922_08780 [Bacteroidales bacterium]|nr:hypothetical protein [Bacteroidales bacterium]